MTTIEQNRGGKTQQTARNHCNAHDVSEHQRGHRKNNKTIVKTVETKDIQTSILHNQKIALHKSLLKKQEKQEKQNENAHHPA